MNFFKSIIDVTVSEGNNHSKMPEGIYPVRIIRADEIHSGDSAMIYFEVFEGIYRGNIICKVFDNTDMKSKNLYLVGRMLFAIEWDAKLKSDGPELHEICGLQLNIQLDKDSQIVDFFRYTSIPQMAKEICINNFKKNKKN